MLLQSFTGSVEECSVSIDATEIEWEKSCIYFKLVRQTNEIDVNVLLLFKHPYYDLAVKLVQLT